MHILYLSLLAASCLLAETYELGAGGGVVFHTSRSITGRGGSAQAGLSPGFAGTGYVTHNMYHRISGEFRYVFQWADLKLSAASTQAKFASQGHIAHYDLVIHTTHERARLRPYVAFGGGVKVLVGTGVERETQPLEQFALLTKTTESLGMASLGGGVKINTAGRLQFRADIHDYITPFPSKVITPTSGGGPGGLLHGFVVTFSVGGVF